MKKVTAYQTSDGQMFDNLPEANTAEFKIVFQGFFNRNGTQGLTTLTPKQAANTVDHNLEEMIAILQKRKDQKRREAKKSVSLF